MPKSPSKQGQEKPCPRIKKPSGGTRRPRTQDPMLYRLHAMGIGLTAAAAFLSWGVRFSIDTDWSMAQMAENAPKCDRKTISNALPAALASGLAVKVSAPVFNGFKKPGNRRGTYRFTEKFYAMLGQARTQSRQRQKREKFPMPLAFEVPVSRSHSSVQHDHQAPGVDDHAPTGAGEPKEAPEVVQALVEVAKLDEKGARTAARAIPEALRGEILPFLIQAVLAETERRKPGLRKSPEHFIHFLLTTHDRKVVEEARKRLEKSKALLEEGRRTGASTTWAKAAPSFRALPGAQAAIFAWEKAKREAEKFNSLYLWDEAAAAREAVVKLAHAATGIPPCAPGAPLGDRRKRTQEVLIAVGLN